MNNSIDILKALSLTKNNITDTQAVSCLYYAREIWQKQLQEKYVVRDEAGIEKLISVKIGGADQWLHIRGRDRNNPVLLYIHGGPGGAMIGWMDEVQRPWEDFFTVVMWDQRQTGKSYYSAQDDVSPLTVKQFVDDAESVATWLRSYLKKDKLVVLGHSWGTAIGMHLLKRRPEWVHAYIGLGQFVNGIENDRANYQRLIFLAKQHGEVELAEEIQQALTTLDSCYPDRERSYVKNCIHVRRELSRLAGETLSHHMPWDEFNDVIKKDMFMSPHLTISDLENILLGDEIAVFRPPYTFTQEFLNIDLPTDVGSEFEAPVFFFTGAHDWHTPYTLSDKWFSEISAPHKEMVRFENSSHFIINEEPGKFLMSLVNRVRPFTNNEKVF